MAVPASISSGLESQWRDLFNEAESAFTRMVAKLNSVVRMRFELVLSDHLPNAMPVSDGIGIFTPELHHEMRGLNFSFRQVVSNLKFDRKRFEEVMVTPGREFFAGNPEACSITFTIILYSTDKSLNYSKIIKKCDIKHITSFK